MTTWVAVANPDQSSGPAQFERDNVSSRRNSTTLLVQHFNSYDRDVLAVCSNLLPISAQIQSHRCAGCLTRARQESQALPALGGARVQHPWLIFHLPLDVRILFNVLAPKTLSIQKQFDSRKIRVAPNVDFLTFSTWPVPMRKQMHNGL